MRKASVVVAILFAVHTLALLTLFTPLVGLIDRHPLVEQDWGPLFHHVTSAQAFVREDGRLWGYNPLFMAGYPSNTIQDVSVKFFEIAALASPALGLTPIQGLKLLATGTASLVPWLMFWAARLVSRGLPSEPRVAIAASILGTVYWWAAFPREMFFYGMIGFPLACYVALLAAALLYRISLTDRRLSVVHAAWLATAVILPPLHLEGVLVLGLTTAGLFAVLRGPALRRLMVWTATGAAVSIVVNLPWLLPYVSHLGDDTSGAMVRQLGLFQTPDAGAFVADYLEPGGYFTFRGQWWANAFRWALLIVGAPALLKMARSDRKTAGVALATGAVLLYLLTYFGSLSSSLAALQPLRFKIALDLVLCIGAAFAFTAWRRWVLGAGLTAAVIGIVASEAAGEMRLRTVRSDAMSAIVRWIAEDTPADARVLFEESGDESGFVYDGMYLSSFIAHETSRQLIGGPLNLYNDRHHFAEFHSGRLFSHDIGRLSDDAIAQYLRVYNIGAIVSFTPQAVARFLRIPGVVAAGQVGPVALLRVNQPASWFLAGSGRVAATPGGLRLTELAGDEVILKYHWIDGLTAAPSVELIPERVLDDPIPFIKILKPPTTLELRVR